MRVLVIDKTAGLDASHERHQAMAGEDGVELHVLGPRHWVENGRDIIWRPPIDARYQAHRGRVVGKGHYARVWYVRGMASALLQSKPDIIQLLEEPWSLTALQTMLYAPLFAPHAKMLFYSWENIYRPWTYPARASCLYAMIDKAMHTQSCAAVCATEGARQVLEQKGYAKPCAVVPYGIPHYFFDDQPEPSPRNSFTIGYVGRMLEMKGVDLLIHAMAQIPDAQLRLVGTGEDFASIQSLCKQLNVADRVEWIAALTEREVPAFMSELDALVLPSRTTQGWMEQLGRVLIEAMAVGTPVIGARSGAIPEVIGDAGLLFNEDDSGDLVIQLLRLKDNQNFRTECRQRGRRRAQTQFIWPHFAKQMLHFYRTLLAESKSANE